jgi:tetratricopeptide (TPR) repeat protein
MARTFSSVDEINEYRSKREVLFKQAVRMHDSGDLSDTEFTTIQNKHRKTIASLAKAEAELTVSIPKQPFDTPPPVRLASDGMPAPHVRSEPSARDLAMLSVKREVPESVTRPRQNELADLVKQKNDDVELEQIKELYQRELFVKEKLRQRLDEETETKSALTDQILEITNAKDAAATRSKAARKAAHNMKKVAILLFAVTVCLFLLFIISYYRDVKGAQQHLVESKGAAAKISEQINKVEALEKLLEDLKKANNSLQKDLTVKEGDVDVALREQKRLEQKLGEARSVQGTDVRKMDIIGLDYALLLKEQPSESDEDLLRQIADLHSTKVANVQQTLSDYTATPAGHIASGVSEILKGGSVKSALSQLKEAVLREAAIFKKLLRLAAILAGEEQMTEERVHFLQTASSLDPSDVYLRLELAEAFISVGNIDYAIANFKICAEELPERGDVALRLGHLLERKGKTEEALLVYETCLAKSSDDRNLLTAVAGLKVQSGDYMDAVKLLEHCLSVSDNSTQGVGNVHFNLAFAYVGLGQIQKASEHCEKAKALGTDVSALETFLKSTQ